MPTIIRFRTWNRKSRNSRLRRPPATYRKASGGRQFPQYALAGAIAREVDQWRTPIAIETPDRIVQVAFGILIRVGQQGIVNPSRPALLFKRIQHGLLRVRWHSVSLDHVLADIQHATLGIPTYCVWGG